MLCGWEGNRNLAERNGSLPPDAWMTYSHLRADCLYTGISSGPTLGNEYGKPLPLPLHSLYVSFEALTPCCFVSLRQ